MVSTSILKLGPIDSSELEEGVQGQWGSTSALPYKGKNDNYVEV